MLVRTILEQKVAAKRTAKSVELIQDINLFAYLTAVPDKFKQQLISIQEMTYHSKEQKEAKVNMPLFYVCGTFNDSSAKDSNIAHYNNLMCVDIDSIDNPNIDLMQLRDKIFNLPYVIGVYKSISGKGIYALIYIEDGKSTTLYYKYILKLWKYLFGINIDEQAGNVARARFISYDEDRYKYTKQLDCNIEPWKLKFIENQQTPHKPIIDRFKIDKQKQKESDEAILKLTIKAINKLLNDGYNTDNFSNSYYAWYHLGCEFKHFDSGKEMFIKLSTNSSNNDTLKTIESKWNECCINSDLETVERKWLGMAKNKYGSKWWKS